MIIEEVQMIYSSSASLTSRARASRAALVHKELLLQKVVKHCAFALDLFQVLLAPNDEGPAEDAVLLLQRVDL